MNTQTELINGFGDVMQHIREQEQRIKELNNKNNSYRKKINQFIEQKQELEAKVDEAQVAFEENKKYKKEIDTLTVAVENECEASGIMEIMNMRIEDAENKAREQELFKVLAEKELENEIKEKKELHEEINELGDALENAEIYKCEECSKYFPSRGMEDVFHRNCCDLLCVCLECRDNKYCECDECRDFHHLDNISTVFTENGGQHEVCHLCNEDHP